MGFISTDRRSGGTQATSEEMTTSLRRKWNRYPVVLRTGILVLGSSATGAAIWMIPFSASVSGLSIVAGYVITRTGTYRGVIWVAWALLIVGWGLMTTLDDYSNTTEKVLYTLITASGIGCLFQSPITALQAAMPLKDMATSTGAFDFLRTIGGTIGISIGQVINSSVLKKKINRIPNLSGIKTSPAALAESVRTLQPPTSTRTRERADYPRLCGVD